MARWRTSKSGRQIGRRGLKRAAIPEVRASGGVRDRVRAVKRNATSLMSGDGLRVARINSGLLYSTAGQFVVAGAALASIRIYTQIMPREEFGVVTMLMGAIALLDGLVTASLSQTLLSLCAGISDEESQRQVCVGLSMRAQIAVLILAAPVLFITTIACRICGWGAALALGEGAVILYLIEEIAKTSMLAPLIARRDYGRSSIWIAVEALVNLIVTAAFLLTFHADALTFLFGLLCARLLCTGSFWVWYFRGQYFRHLNLRISRPHVRRALTYGTPVSAMAPLGWISAYLDRYVVATRVGLDGAGVYAAASALVGRPYSVTTSALTNYFRPQLFHSGGKAEREWLIAAAGIGALGVAAFALWGGFAARLALAEAYRGGATSLLAVLALAQTFVIVTHGLDNAILAAGAAAPLLKLQACLVVVSVLLPTAGALLGGALGAALGRAAAELVKCGATAILSLRLSRRGSKGGAATP